MRKKELNFVEKFNSLTVEEKIQVYNEYMKAIKDNRHIMEDKLSFKTYYYYLDNCKAVLIKNKKDLEPYFKKALPEMVEYYKGAIYFINMSLLTK